MDAATDEFVIENHRTYDSFGNLTAETDPAVSVSFAFTGKFLDDQTGLSLHLNRWFDPQLGKWISQDPIGFAGGDTNLSRYIGNGPTNGRDPLGLMVQDIDRSKGSSSSGSFTETRQLNGDVLEVGIDFNKNGGRKFSKKEIPRVRRSTKGDQLYSPGDIGGDLGELAGRSGSAIKGYLWNTPKNFAKGIYDLVVNFNDVLEFLDFVGNHPVEAAKLIGEGVVEDITNKLKTNEGQGELAGDAVLALVPISKIKEIAKLSRLLKKLGPDKLAPNSTVLGQVDNLKLEWLQKGRIIEVPQGTQGIRKMMSDLTLASGNEVALVRLANGKRALVMGGPNSVVIPKGASRIIAHTHPKGSLRFSQADIAGFNQLKKNGERMFKQWSSVIIAPLEDFGIRLPIPGR